MKIFQIVGNIVHYDMTHLYSSAVVARTKYPSTTQIVEAPDYVFEGWGFNPNESGDNRYIKPTPPKGWGYDDATGTFYNIKTKEVEWYVKKVLSGDITFDKVPIDYLKEVTAIVNKTKEEPLQVFVDKIIAEVSA